MKVLIIGNGGREHAICRALMTANPQPSLFIAPGNPGTAECGENVAIAVDDIEGIVDYAKQHEIDLVIPGPELPLVLGIGDALDAAGIPCCGPGKGASQLEGSKAFTREITETVNVPAPRFEKVTTSEALRAAINSWDGVPVVKADGLASGKGVFLPETKEGCIEAGEKLLAGEMGEAGSLIVLEDRLFGVEASLFYACNGLEAVALPHARDHKRLLDGDEGPNTGGMGAISPNPEITPELQEQVFQECVLPTLHALKDAGMPFRGFLFGGFMLTQKGPKLLEYNVRLGDPETQAILPRLPDGAFLDLCMKTATGNLDGLSIAESDQATCAIVLAAAGYPESPRKGDSIKVSDKIDSGSCWLIHAGTKTQGADLQTSGGRVAAIVCRNNTPELARTGAYEALDYVSFDGAQYREDIGTHKEI
ncbi:MAG: phosphoribosylamine--glycine ligase [Deltaproteobacteria bacterium]|jgi:phosphoribosylamine---glycine ligase|nr:phosphoribosylamine--glycine ligase [Deltaproteobacteria bacterium]